MKTVSLETYLILGRSLQFLLQCKGGEDAGHVVSSIETCASSFKDLGFTIAPRVLERLVVIGKDIEHAQVSDGTYDKGITPDLAQRISATAGNIIEEGQNQASRRFLLEVDQKAASEKLRALMNGKLDKHQEILMADTILCLECGAYRAAMVMGWNVTYEHVRRWIFTDHAKLNLFNTVLTTKNKTKNKLYDKITEYEQFFELGERLVIDTAYEANLFIKDHHQVLVHGLTARNQFAHPNYVEATTAIAAGNIEMLVVNIVNHKDFN